MIDIITKKSSGFLPKTVTRDQAKDTGMAMTLICLLIGYFGHKDYFVGIAIVLLLGAMTWPPLFKPVGRLWFGLSFLMGIVLSKVLLSILFFAIVTPIGLIRRVTGADPLQLKKWKKDRTSVFRVRNHIFSSADLDKPY
jgi:hypothetical protein